MVESRTDILFYSRDEKYGWLSNFYRAKQIIDGVEYPTNEHFYQCMKARDKLLKIWIRNAPYPYYAMKVGRLLRLEKKEIFSDWEDVKVSVMAIGLLAKFTQNPDLKQKLLDTGDASLHENSPTDMFWGIKGKDMLGKLLMKVREELRCKKL